jgi:hypothetical protein
METIKSPGILFYIFSFYAYYLPIILYVLWTPLSIYDIGKRKDLSSTLSSIWTFCIILFPWIGSIFYFLFGKSQISTFFKMILILPGVLLAILFAVYSTLTAT